MDVSIHASVKDATFQGAAYAKTLAVSIHASVKDATTFTDAFLGELIVSIHASVKDATSCSLLYIRQRTGFNPRICKRCDLKYSEGTSASRFQSTHL